MPDPIAPVEPPVVPVEPKPNPNDTVSYESHSKLLNEHKKRKDKLNAANEELEAFRSAKREREESELAARGEHEKIISTHKDRIAELELNETNRHKRDIEAKKFNAFFKGLDGEVDEKYWSLIDVSEIAVDPDSGEIDSLSVANTIEKFKREYTPIIQGQPVPNLPNAAPSGSTGTITVEEWKQLPLPERKARMKEVYNNLT